MQRIATPNTSEASIAARLRALSDGELIQQSAHAPDHRVALFVRAEQARRIFIAARATRLENVLNKGA